MSVRSTQFKRKVGQARRVGITDFSGLIHYGQAKSAGRRTVFGQVDSLDEDGNPQKAGKRYPGRATNKVCTEPPKTSTVERWRRIAK